MKKIIKVEGMKCEYCKNSVINALKEIKDIQNVEINLDSKEVVIESNNKIDMTIIKEKISEKDLKLFKC